MRNATRFLFLFIATQAMAVDWYVGPDGASSNPGTREKPWDLESALLSKQIQPGDNLCLLPGTYKRRPKEQFEIKLKGSEEKPVVVRPAEYGQRVTIDGGLAVMDPSAFLWIRDLEILVSEPDSKDPVPAGSHPEAFARPWGGLNMHGGKNCKYINCIIHDTRQAISCWTGETDCEIYGCIMYDNGWRGTDRGHGHCIYTQNKTGVKTIRHCIMSAKYDGAYTVHAYGSSKAFIDNYLIEENFCYERGPFLVGGGSPSHGIHVQKNYLSGVAMQIGYGAQNEDCEVRDNFLAGGTLSINKFNKAVNENNTIIAKDKLPGEPKVVLLKNRYDETRAYLAVYNFSGAKELKVALADFAKAGDTIELRDSRKFYDAPLEKLNATAEGIVVRLNAPFSVFVLGNSAAKRPY